MHHTDCGLARLDGPEQRGLMAYFFGVEEDEVAAKHLTDPVESVRTDLEIPARKPAHPSHADRVSRHLRHRVRARRDHLLARPARSDLLDRIAGPLKWLVRLMMMDLALKPAAGALRRTSRTSKPSGTARRLSATVDGFGLWSRTSVHHQRPQPGPGPLNRGSRPARAVSRSTACTVSSS